MQSRKAKKISALFIYAFAAFFVCSLTLHNHAFHLGTSPEKFSQSKSAYTNHSTEFCSACRLTGNFKPSDSVNTVDSDRLGNLLGYLDHNLLIPSLFLESNKNPRSPPTI